MMEYNYNVYDDKIGFEKKSVYLDSHYGASAGCAMCRQQLLSMPRGKRCLEIQGKQEEMFFFLGGGNAIAKSG